MKTMMICEMLVINCITEEVIRNQGSNRINKFPPRHPLRRIRNIHQELRLRVKVRHRAETLSQTVLEGNKLKLICGKLTRQLPCLFNKIRE